MKPVSWRCPRCKHDLGGVFYCDTCGISFNRVDGVWYSSEPIKPPGSFTPSRCRHLLEIERDHFWFLARDKLIEILLSSLLLDGDSDLLELGCGSGRMLPSMAATNCNVIAVDAYPELLAHARNRCQEATLIQADVGDLPLADAQFDIVLALDVLEHVEPDLLLSEARRVARPGGRIIISVPASSYLWSEADTEAGHRCRYNRFMLFNELARNGWIPAGYTYYQFFLYPVIWLSRRFIYKKTKIERHPPRWFSAVSCAINTFEASCLRGLSLPWGSSLLMWARRT